MIIFGTRAYTRLLATLMLVCSSCQRPAAHHVVDRVVKFTLFFIPLFPVSTRHLLTCTFCGRTGQITAEQSADLVRAAAPAPGDQYLQPGPSAAQPPSIGGQPVTPYPAQPGPAGAGQYPPQPPLGGPFSDHA